MQEHYDEIAENKSILHLNPQRAVYETLGDKVLLVTARNDGRLVGYFLWIISSHPHYQDTIVAAEDLHFLAKKYRRGLTGYKFMKYAIEAAQARASFLVIREKLAHHHPALMNRLGFKATDIVYTKAT